MSFNTCMIKKYLDHSIYNYDNNSSFSTYKKTVYEEQSGINKLSSDALSNNFIENYNFSDIPIRNAGIAMMSVAIKMIEIFNRMNLGEKSQWKGMWYPYEWSYKFVQHLPPDRVSGLAHPDFWIPSFKQANPKTHSPKAIALPFPDNLEALLEEKIKRAAAPSIVALCARPSVSPKNALSSLFAFSVMDCSAATQAACLTWLCKIGGEALFNNTFGQPLCPISLTPFFFNAACEGTNPFDNPIGMFYITISPSSNPEPGDVINFQGIEGYEKRHPLGDFGGYNVICVGPDRYIGFGSIFNEGPLSGETINRALYDGYHQAPTEAEIKWFTHNSQAPLHDVDAIVGGISAIKRINVDFLQAYLDGLFVGWQHNSLTYDFSPSHVVRPNNSWWQAVPHENKNLEVIKELFSSDTRDTSVMKKFLYQFLHQSSSHPLGLILSGPNGTGKSTMATSLGVVAEHLGKQVAFFSSQGFCEFSESTLQSIDLIILDDFNNSSHTFSHDFMSKAIKWAVENNKAILITTNSSAYELFIQGEEERSWFHRSCLPSTQADILTNKHRWISWHNVEGSTRRVGWYNEVSHDDPLDQLLQYQGTKPAGIALLSGADPENIRLRIQEMGHEAGVVSFPGEKPMTYDRSKKILIFPFIKKYYADDLSSVIQHVWNNNLKLIVLVSTNSWYQQFLNGQRTSAGPNQKRLLARISAIFKGL